MRTIGASSCTWTSLLLLCSIPALTFAYGANETVSAVAESSSAPAASSIAASSSATKNPPSVVTPSPPNPSAISFFSDTTCPFKTINYITHTLPQQCLKTTWSAPRPTPSEVAEGEQEAGSTGVATPITEGEADNTSQEGIESVAASVSSQATSQAADTPAETATSTESGAETEGDSPLDNANFLSFEEWKKQNLAQAGQSPENVGQGRASSDTKPRRRPVNVNALDSLGEEGEIEINFEGFGNSGTDDEGINTPRSSRPEAGATKSSEDDDKVAPSSWALSKDAGKTCKERFNYASFDCAATVLKTNAQTKSSSAVLVENKDSYLLNECSAQNKFIIVELCDDILVDTVVLANYEFFSSMFRHFRVSVSDRYPVKIDRWRTLATFEARNSRELQPFLVKAPQIWARYLRIEFLTHYGNEFYCPLSLLRVHGTTMMEQFRREEEEARGDEDSDEPIEAAAEEPVMTAAAVTEGSGEVHIEQVPVQVEKQPNAAVDDSANHSTSAAEPGQTPTETAKVERNPTDAGHQSETTSATVPSHAVGSVADDRSAEEKDSSLPSALSAPQPSTRESVKASETSKTDDSSSSSAVSSSSQDTPSDPTDATSFTSQSGKSTSSVSTDGASTVSGSSTTKVAANSTANSTHSHSQASTQRASSYTQPNPSVPTTQESFYKSIHKRLQNLETNATLSLQYIEEQSRILRDAFIKTEKRQLAKTETFLQHINSTVLSELKSYRNMYEQLWQSVILELEGMKERQKSEVGEIGARLSLVADELVWQKRMAVVQSTLLLLCLGLVLFVRSGPLAAQLDVPIVQQLGNKYSRFFDYTPPQSPGSGRRRRGLRGMWRSDTEDAGDIVGVTSDAETEGERSLVHINYEPPTPNTPAAASDLGHETGSSPPHIIESSPPQPNGILGDITNGQRTLPSSSPTPDPDGADQAKRIQVLETQSGPATPRGSRDTRPSWEEVEKAVEVLKAEEEGQHVDELAVKPLPREMRKRSPLRRTESYDDTVDGHDSLDDGEVDDVDSIEVS